MTPQPGAVKNHPAAAPHALDPHAVLAQMETTAAGLSTAEAQARLQKFGPNRLEQHRGQSALVRFLLQFHNVLIYVLLVAAIVTALLQYWIDTAVILGVVVINAIIGFIQEGKAEKALDAIRRMLSLKALVLRDARQQLIAAEELVTGDIVTVQSGDRVPADLRLLKLKNLRVEEASLTGESLPVEKTTAPVAADAPLGDRACLAFSGTLVTFGQGTGVVVATGARTELGRISALLEHTERIETPLLRQIGVFSAWLSGVIVLVAVLTFALGVSMRGYGMAEMFLAAVSLAVAAIPEGLPAVITITLALGVQRMARRNAIVRQLPAVEALGSVTTICSDKTGTLTRNEMTVQAIATADGEFAVSGVGYEPHGDFLLQRGHVELAQQPTLLELARAGLLCNDAALRQHEGQWLIEGDPTEAALVVLARKAGLDAHSEGETWPRTDVIPFESEHRFMATLHHDHAGHGFIYLKGAPERVLANCAFERGAGTDRHLRHAHWHEQIERMAGNGQRVLAIAFKSADAGHRDLTFRDVEDGMTLLGLVGMVDPPREEAIRAVAAAQRAGITVKMITGDHAITAGAVARRLGLRGEPVITGNALETMSDDALREAVTTADVYARVSPEHKLRLVFALQARREVVAMTGDGVNDAPALKRADVGVAMGITGTDAAKEAAEIVLADDNFASITSAIEEGRTIYDNLRKTILFILPTNGAQSLVLLVAIALGMVLPILPVQILWVNMVTAVTLALSLAFEPTEPGTMERPPRDARAPLFSGYFLWRTLLVSVVLVTGTLAMFVWELAQGASIEAARTAAVNTLVVFEAFYLLSARYLTQAAWPHRALAGNPYIPLTIVLVLALQLLFTYVPFMNTLFHTAPLALDAWARLVPIAASVYIIVELEKAVVRALHLRIA